MSRRVVYNLTIDKEFEMDEKKVYLSVRSRWRDIKSRCYDPKDNNYKHYGQRGIKLYEPWKNDFLLFFNTIGCPLDLSLSIDRIDNHKGYFPGNIRWSTNIEQANNKRNNVTISYQGKTQTIADWARELQIHKSTISKRLRNGHPIEKVLSRHPTSTGERLLTFQNQTRSIEKWSKHLGIKASTLRHRLKRGWSIERTLTTPIKNK